MTVEVVTKFVPVSVIKNGPLPVGADAGLRLVRDGTGLFTVKVSTAVVPPPGAGLFTVTGRVPAWAIKLAGIVAVI